MNEDGVVARGPDTPGIQHTAAAEGIPAAAAVFASGRMPKLSGEAAGAGPESRAGVPAASSAAATIQILLFHPNIERQQIARTESDVWRWLRAKCRAAPPTLVSLGRVIDIRRMQAKQFSRLNFCRRLPPDIRPVDELGRQARFLKSNTPNGRTLS